VPPTKPTDIVRALDDLHPTAERVAALLGDDWTLADPAAPNLAHLSALDGRRLGMRAIPAHAAIQLWVIGFEVPAPPNDVSPEEYAAYQARLAPGRYWHTVQYLSHLAGPAVDLPTALHQRIADRLLPVFQARPTHVTLGPWPNTASTKNDAGTGEPIAAAADPRKRRAKMTV
jgi:hypothetical protein